MTETRLLVCLLDAERQTEWRCRVAFPPSCQRRTHPGTWGDICCAVKRRYCSLLWRRVWAFRAWSADGVQGERKGRRSEEFQHTRPFRWKSLSCSASQGLILQEELFLVLPLLCSHLTRPTGSARVNVWMNTPNRRKKHKQNKLSVPGCAPEKRLQIQSNHLKYLQLAGSRAVYLTQCFGSFSLFPWNSWAGSGSCLELICQSSIQTIKQPVTLVFFSSCFTSICCWKHPAVSINKLGHKI